jgi:hypothetical protein
MMKAQDEGHIGALEIFAAKGNDQANNNNNNNNNNNYNNDNNTNNYNNDSLNRKVHFDERVVQFEFKGTNTPLNIGGNEVSYRPLKLNTPRGTPKKSPPIYDGSEIVSKILGNWS